MENKIENQIIITDSEGKEHLMEILFTYEHPERKTSYVFFFEPGHPEEIIAMQFQAPMPESRVTTINLERRQATL